MSYNVKCQSFVNLHIRSTPKLADILQSEFSEELDVLLVEVLGLSDKFNGVSPVVSLLLNDGTEIPEGLPLVAGNFITSTRSFAEDGGELTSCWSYQNHVKI